MVCFEDLPPELITSILEEASPTTWMAGVARPQYQELLSFSRISSFFAPIAQELMHGRLDLTSERSAKLWLKERYQGCVVRELIFRGYGSERAVVRTETAMEVIRSCTGLQTLRLDQECFLGAKILEEPNLRSQSFISHSASSQLSLFIITSRSHSTTSKSPSHPLRKVDSRSIVLVSPFPRSNRLSHLFQRPPSSTPYHRLAHRQGALRRTSNPTNQSSHSSFLPHRIRITPHEPPYRLLVPRSSKYKGFPPSLRRPREIVDRLREERRSVLLMVSQCAAPSLVDLKSFGGVDIVAGRTAVYVLILVLLFRESRFPKLASLALYERRLDLNDHEDDWQVERLIDEAERRGFNVELHQSGLNLFAEFGL